MSIHAPVPELYVSSDSAAKLKVAAGSLPSWDLTARQVCDLELLMNGGFYPLKGFQSQADYISTVETMRTSDGALWPIPVTLDVSGKFADGVEPGQDIALRDRVQDQLRQACSWFRIPLVIDYSGSGSNYYEATKK